MSYGLALEGGRCCPAPLPHGGGVGSPFRLQGFSQAFLFKLSIYMVQHHGQGKFRVHA